MKIEYSKAVGLHDDLMAHDESWDNAIGMMTLHDGAKSDSF